MKETHGEEPLRPFGCYGNDELVPIRNRIKHIPALLREYKRQKKLSEQFEVEEAEATLHLLGAYRVDPFVFETPPGTAYLQLAIHIQGRGEARIGGLRLTHSQRGLPVALTNGSFERGLEGWYLETAAESLIELQPFTSVQAALQPSGATPAAAGESAAAQCLYIHNQAEDEETVLHYGAAVPVHAGQHYSAQTALSLAAALSGGVRAEVRFLDAMALPVAGSLLSPPFNRHTLTNWSYLLEAASADANVYMATGERSSAERSKRKLMYILADMRQGMDIFKRTGWHDDDTYGAVHIGRGLAVTSVIFDQIADSGSMDSHELTLILENFRYIAAMMMDTDYYRFDLAEFPDEKGGMRSNWNADRATGIGIYALLFPKEEQAAEYLEHACSVVEWQLEHVVDGDGAWPENIRYHGAVLHRYFLFFTLLKRLKAVNYFQHGKVKAMYRFLIGTAISPDRIQGGPSASPRLLTPAVGDANVHEQWFRLLAYAAPSYAEQDPQLAGEMSWAWRRGGEPIQDTGAFPCPLVALLYPQPDLPELEPVLGSVQYSGVGYVIFRSGKNVPGRGHYAIYEASPLTYHAHHDEGHFSIWAESVPLTLDSGTGGYYNGDRHWFVSAAAHNVVQFADSTGRLQNGPLRSHCEEVFFSDELDYARSTIPDENAADYQRHFAFLKAGFNVYLVWDRIDGGVASEWNLHTLSSNAEIAGQSITAHCLGNMKLNALIAEPSGPVISVDEGAVGGNYPLAAQQHFRIHGEPESDYLVLLRPQAEDTPALHLEPFDCRTLPKHVRLYKVEQQGGNWFIIAINGSNQAQCITLQGIGPLRAIGSRSPVATDQSGAATLSLESGTLHVLVPQ